LAVPYERELAFARGIAREAGALLVQAYGHVASREKGPSDLVTEADTASQRLIASAIAREFPEHTLQAEEEGVVADPAKPWKWIVDPLDGTINFAHGFPFWCVSIALEHEGKLVVGVVHDPLAGVSFWATLGGGAWKDGGRIVVSKTESLRSSLVSAGLPTAFASDTRRQLGLFEAFSTHTHSVRRTGSTALNLGYLAAGGFDVYYTTSVHPWDVAAGVLIVEEAGGRVTALDGTPYRLDQPSLLATNRLLHEEALARAAGSIPGA
jgi:myo-inositol-1(or 4)-monophosphatase